MIARPKFKSNLRVAVGPDHIALDSETGSSRLEGRIYSLLAPLLNGRHTIPEILERLAEQADVLLIHYGLSELEEGGFIVEADDRVPFPQSAFRDTLNIEPETFRTRLLSTTVSVHALGKLATKPMESILRSSGINVGGGNDDFAVVLVRDYLDEALNEVNRSALDRGRPWMLAKPIGTVLWVGPIFQPGKTACWNCLADRLRQNRTTGSASPSFASIPASIQLGLGLAATEVWKWVVQNGNSEIEGKLLTLDLKTSRMQHHAVIRQERCAHCGGNPPLKNRLDRRQEIQASDGGYRVVAPEITFEKFRHHISDITGIVSGVEPARVETHGLVHVFIAPHNFSVRGIANGGRNRRNASAGKGMTPPQARIGALCEALERYSGIFRGHEKRRRAPYRKLIGNAIHPGALLNFSEQQYANRDKWNRHEQDFNWIPEPFDEKRDIDWTAAWSLTEERLKYVPTAYCYYGYPPAAGHDFCRADSNGNAAGNTREEAILQGFLELVERDSVALWWYNRARRPAIQLNSFNHPYFQALPRYYRRLGREIWVLDITGDLEIPAFAAVSPRQSRKRNDMMLGFGAHLNPEIALARALTELNQFLPAIIEGKPPQMTSEPLSDDAFCRPAAAVPARCLREFRSLDKGDLAENIRTCVRLAKRRKIEVLVLDQTRSDVGLPVVKVVAPGLRQFWARFAPGRLYETPVKMGWLKAPLKEEQMNAAHLIM